MRKVLAIFFVLVICSLALPACESADNVAACESWLDSMECGTQDFSTLVDCEIYSPDTYPCDVSDYFDCLTDEGSCDEDLGIYDAAGWTSCADLASCD